MIYSCIQAHILQLFCEVISHHVNILIESLHIFAKGRWQMTAFTHNEFVWICINVIIISLSPRLSFAAIYQFNDVLEFKKKIYLLWSPSSSISLDLGIEVCQNGSLAVFQLRASFFYETLSVSFILAAVCLVDLIIYGGWFFI